MAFAPDYAAAGASTSTTRTATATSASSSTSAASADRADAGLRAARAAHAGRRVQPQRRPAAVRPRRPALHRHRRRRRRRRPARRARQRAEPRHAARQDPADRPARARRRAPTRSRRQPVRRPRRRARRDLRLRPAQPVALLVRPPHRRPRRSATSARTTVEEIDFVRRGKGAGRELRLARRSRAAAATRRRARARRVAAGDRSRRHADGYCSITGGVVVRDPRAVRAAAAATSSATSASGGSARPRLRGRRARATSATSSCRSQSLSSFGEDARGRVYVVVARRAGLPARAAVSGSDVDAASARRNPGPLTLDRHEHLGRRARPGLGGRSRAGARRRTWTRSRRRSPRAAARAGSRSPRPRRPRRGRRGAARAARRRAGRRRARRRCADGDAFGPLRGGRTSPATPTTTWCSSRAASPSPATPCSARAACSCAGRLGEYLDGLRRLRGARTSSGCAPATAPPVEDPAAKLDEYLAHRLERERRLLEALERGRAHARTSCSTPRGPTRPPALRAAAALTLRAHLGKLRDEGRLPDGLSALAGRGLGEPPLGDRGGRASGVMPCALGASKIVRAACRRSARTRSSRAVAAS